MPWSEKARGLIRNHYAPVGRIGRANLNSAYRLFEDMAKKNKYDEETMAKITDLCDIYKGRADDLAKYTVSYRNYCEHVDSVDDIKIAPFHLLAYDEIVNMGKDSTHLEDHINVIRKYVVDDKNFVATPYMMVNTENPDDVKDCIDWWLDATSHGYEGMVVKPSTYTAYNEHGQVIQPAIKCRGKEYLRIIYGPEYTSDIQRLKKRSLSAKRGLAINEFALGIDSLTSFVKQKAFYKVHQSALAVLANEFEPVDVRL